MKIQKRSGKFVIVVIDRKFYDEVVKLIKNNPPHTRRGFNKISHMNAISVCN